MNPLALKRLELAGLIAATHLTTLTSATIGNWVAAGCPRNPDGTFSLVNVCAWLAAERRRKELGPGDPMLAGPDSPALEEYRRWRAKNEELEYRRKSGELVALEDVKRQWLELGQRMRGQLEAIGNAYGAEVRRAIIKALAEVHGSPAAKQNSEQEKPRVRRS